MKKEVILFNDIRKIGNPASEATKAQGNTEDLFGRIPVLGNSLFTNAQSLPNKVHARIPLEIPNPAKNP
jgi:hypothetical protein